MKAFIYISVIALVLLGFGYMMIFGNSTTGTVTNDTPRSTNPYQTPSAKAASATITYTAAGFEPRDIQVAKGTQVNFLNRTQLPLWVASDPHPEHTDYPELDAGVIAGEHVQPGRDFGFKFDKAGTWKYHNHSAPEHSATITVTE